MSLGIPDTKERYASDRLGRCANAQLDWLRLDALQPHGGMPLDPGVGAPAGGGGVFLDLDVYVLRSLTPWLQRCAAHTAR